jgi:hypothetical protein
MINENIDTIEGLARLIQTTMTSKEDLARLERKVDDGFLHVNARLDLIREDLPVIKEDIKDLKHRVKLLEDR